MGKLAVCMDLMLFNMRNYCKPCPVSTRYTAKHKEETPSCEGVFYIAIT